VAALDHLNILLVKNDQYHSLTKILKNFISTESYIMSHN